QHCQRIHNLTRNAVCLRSFSRKNPIHFQECSHPGDDDYEEEHSADEEADDRPECPYGTDCYRKNPLHKKEYKHTKPPARTTAPVNDEDEDEDQYENSFINDDSEEEDVVEDPDYVPESEDSEKEDIKQLQKEAKAFLQKRK
ncbi:aprataxin and PNK-like factor, partial [Tachysurus ichikawai]